MKTVIVGLGHRARHGKDTVGRLLQDHFGVGVTRYSFGAALKAVARVMGMRGKDSIFLQALGTDVYRRMNPDIWRDVLADQIKEEEPPIAVVTDVRFPNEADWIKSQGGIVVKVERRNEDGSLFLASDRDPDHISETALSQYPFDIEVVAQSGDARSLAAGAVRVTERIHLLLERVA